MASELCRRDERSTGVGELMIWVLVLYWRGLWRRTGSRNEVNDSRLEGESLMTRVAELGIYLAMAPSWLASPIFGNNSAIERSRRGEPSFSKGLSADGASKPKTRASCFSNSGGTLKLRVTAFVSGLLLESAKLWKLRIASLWVKRDWNRKPAWKSIVVSEPSRLRSTLWSVSPSKFAMKEMGSCLVTVQTSI